MARLKPRDDGRYQLYVTIGYDENGKRIRKMVYGSTQKEVQQKKKELLDGLALVRNTTMSVSRWIKIWSETYLTGGYRNRENGCSVANVFERFLGFKAGNPISEIKPSDIQAFAKSKSNCTKSHIKRTKMTLESIFKTAVENGYIFQSPCTGIIWEGVKTGTHKAVSKEIDDLLLNNWTLHSAGIWAMLIRYAGLRPSEAFALDRSCITKDKIIVRSGSHFEHGQLVITEGVTKSIAGQREIPILPPLEPVIEQMPNEGLVCLSTAGEVMTQSASRRNWVSFMRMLEDAYNGVAPRKARRTDRLPESWKWLPKFTPYDLRHSFCSMLYDADVDIKTAQYLMGHSDLNMTLKIYTHLSEQKKMLSYGKLFSLFETETNGCQNGCQEAQKPL